MNETRHQRDDLDDYTLLQVEVEGEAPDAWRLGEFLEANRDSIDATEAENIRRTLRAGGTVVLGGGAAPEVEIRVALRSGGVS